MSRLLCLPCVCVSDEVRTTPTSRRSRRRRPASPPPPTAPKTFADNRPGHVPYLPHPSYATDDWCLNSWFTWWSQIT
ncbi:hypothetical protein EVAR_52327_1 [Eumeta japonica]|uniref:Uncharacterized protein n=1 Tax=Eumeta variegata TaxID=151549 RepID=A0A4C1Y342_EUMVA|nr:hypothetical protein EVAR_52327_1 [Eumeta japonica]